MVLAKTPLASSPQEGHSILPVGCGLQQSWASVSQLLFFCVLQQLSEFLIFVGLNVSIMNPYFFVAYQISVEYLCKGLAFLILKQFPDTTYIKMAPLVVGTSWISKDGVKVNS